MKNIYRKNTITYTIFFCVVTSSSYADTASLSYNDSSTSISLENAEQLELDIGNWSGLESSDQGVIYQDSSANKANTGADLTIDYSSATTPKFVIGGYNNGVSGVEVINNIVTIAKGAVDGSIYGGLSHYTQETSDNIQFTTNSNRVVIGDEAGIILGSVYGGDSVLSFITENIGSSSNNAGSNTLSADDNTVSISRNANIIGSVYGGNSVLSLTTGSTGADTSTNTLLANDNILSISSNANITGSVYGGNSVIPLTVGYFPPGVYHDTNTLSARDNTVSISNNGNITGSIYGGNSVLSFTGSSTGAYINTSTFLAGYNTVSISNNGNITGSIYGGNSALSVTVYGGVAGFTGNTFLADGNMVSISDNGNITGSVYGGNSALSLAIEEDPLGSNQYVVTDDSTANALSADRITVSIGNNTNIAGSVYGGNSVLSLITRIFGSSMVNDGYNTLSADGNTVSIEHDSHIADSVYGGNSAESLATGDGMGYGTTRIGSSYNTFSADGNTASMSYNTNIAGSVYGGNSVLSSISGISSAPGSNTSSLFGAYNTLSANGNTVSIGNNANIIGSIYGGHSVLSLTSGNTNSIGDGSGNTSVFSEGSKLFADGNTVAIGDHSNISGSVYGGYSTLTLTSGDAVIPGDRFDSTAVATVSTIDATLSANGNTVTFNGKLTGKDSAIYGGRVDFDVYTGTETTLNTSTSAKGEFDNTNSLAQAIDNTVTISQNATFNDTASLYGGYLFYNTDDNYAPERYNSFSGNTLNYASASASFKTIGNFENYYFYLNENNKSAVSTDVALITVNGEFINSDTAADDGNGNIQKTANVSNIQLSGISGAGIMNKGQSVILLDVTKATLTQDSFSGTVSLHTLFNTPANNTVKVGLTREADIAYTVNSNTIVASIEDIRIDEEDLNLNVKPLAEGRLAGLENVVRGADLLTDIVQSDNKSTGTFTPIVVINGGFHTYKSGSHIDTRDYRVMVGSRYQILDNIFTGLTVEYGRSNYDTYNNFSTGRVNGDGHTYNYGLSLFSKITMPTNGGNEFYIDDALRFGRTSTEFKTGDLITGSGDIAHYKSKVNYYGVNVGVGYIYNVDDTSRFDSSLRYLWTRLGNDSIVIDGDKVNFEKSNSSKIQLKEKYSYKQNDRLMLSLAGIYEYEFDSKAKTNFSGISIDAPSAQGSTGIMEIEVKGTPVENNQDLSLNVNFKGYAGKRDGVSVAAFVEYDF